MSASTLTIEELTGKKRRLVLTGAGLPLKGAAWQRNTVLNTTWNPGNPEATQHVLSPTLEPSEWNGVWHTEQLMQTPAELYDGQGVRRVALAFELDEVFESFNVGAQLLRVTWTNVIQRSSANRIARADTFKKVRVGRIASYTGKFHHADWCEWTLNFEWTGVGEPPKKTLEFRSDDLVAAFRASMAAQEAASKAIFDDAIRKQANVQGAASTFSLGQLEAFVDAPLQLVDQFGRVAQSFTNRMKQIGDLVIKTRDLPASIASRAFGVATNAVAVSNQFIDQISRKGPEQVTASNRLSVLTRTASYYGRAQTQAQLVSAQNLRLQQQMRRRRSMSSQTTDSNGNIARAGDLLAIHFPRDGETMKTISRHYYQTTELDQDLCRSNGLEPQTIIPPKRRPLIIPTRSTFEQRANRGV